MKDIKNDDLKWQRKMDYNIGLDINIRRRVSLTFDVYRSVTENMLTSITLPPSVGFNSLQENMGKAINTGWDLRSSFTVLENTRERSFLTVNISMSHNKNRIDKEDPIDILEIDNTAVREAQIARLKKLKAERNQAEVDAALDAITKCVETGEGNLLE